MNGRIKTHYQGWDITVRCLNTRRAHGQSPAPGGYTASAIAVLRDKGDSDSWIDARSQRSTSVHGSFETSASCAESLLEEVKILIDSMRRAPSRPPVSRT